MLAFVDESFQRITADPAVFLTTYSAVMVRRHFSREFARELFNQKKRLWNESDPHKKELKGRLLLNPRKCAENETFVMDLLRMAKQYEIAFFAVTSKGPLASFKGQTLRLPTLFQYLLERINNYTALKANDFHAAVIFDSVEDKTNRTIALNTTNFLFRTTFGATFAHLLDFPMFGDSASTPGIQLADIVAYVVNNWHSKQRQDLDGIFAEMRSMTHNWRNGPRTDWGFRYMEAQ